MKLFHEFNILKILSNTKNFVLDLIFPINCIGCEKEGLWLCRPCFKRIVFNEEQSCFVCNKDMEFGQTCIDCMGELSIDGIWVAGSYKDEVLKKIIKKYKYNFVSDLSKVIGEFLNYFLRNILNQARFIDESRQLPSVLSGFGGILLVSVPLHPKRERWRGFNQSSLLARQVANFFSLEFNDSCLVRVRYGKAQAKIDIDKRRGNIRNSFRWVGKDLSGRNVVVIDDVITSGSTISEIARVLKQNGAGEVWGLAVAKG